MNNADDFPVLNSNNPPQPDREPHTAWQRPPQSIYVRQAKTPEQLKERLDKEPKLQDRPAPVPIPQPPQLQSQNLQAKPVPYVGLPPGMGLASANNQILRPQSNLDQSPSQNQPRWQNVKQAQRRPVDLESLKDLLDKDIPQDGETIPDDATILKTFIKWYTKPYVDKKWAAVTIVLMDQGVFDNICGSSSDRRDMIGVYRRFALRRMYNWMSITDERLRTRYMNDSANIRGPDRERVKEGVFQSPREKNRWVEVNETVARFLLDCGGAKHREREEIVDKFEAFLQGVQSEKLFDWVAANIGGTTPDKFRTKVWEYDALKRMKNWNSIDSSWRQDFFNLAVIPFKNESAQLERFHNKRPDHARCSPQQRNTYLNNVNHSNGRQFTTSQIKNLFEIFHQMNPKYDTFIVANITNRDFTEKEKESRKYNWLKLHYTWRSYFLSSWLNEKPKKNERR